MAFALFFVVAFVVNWLLRPRHTAWRVAMIALSFWFYGSWDARFLLLLAGCAVGNWLVGHAMAAASTADGLTVAGRRIQALGIALDLGVLGIFKYYGFFAASARDALADLGVDAGPPLFEIVLPVGISFFTFQAISYLVDLGRGRLAEPMRLLDLTLYLAFFPQLVAGPIVRATDMARQIDVAPDPRTVPMAEAFWLIGRGLVKKVVISSYLADAIVDPVFGAPQAYSGFDNLVAVYAYAIQIYADFSGYTDIAIGCALLLGFRFPDNFDAPYVAESLQDFWRRWHISLSSFLRDYLYIPLGGNRRGTLFTYRNLVLTMVLGGLWHGAAWQFVIWGAIHGGVLAAERLVTERWSVAGQAAGLPADVVRPLRWLLTFHIVCLAWIFFRAPDTGVATEVITRIATFAPAATPSVVTVTLVAVIGASLASQFVPDRAADDVVARFGGLPAAAQAALAAIVLVAIDVLGPEGVAPFIYFQF